MRVLIVEDDKDAAGFIKEGLERQGLSVTEVYDGATAMEMARAADYDAIILDIEMPGADGYEVLTTLRKEGCQSGILMLTCRSQESEKVRCLKAGADDYLVKPPRFLELGARIEAVLRRRQPTSGPEGILQAGNLKMDTLRHHVECARKPVDLTKTEFDLLEYMARRPNRLLDKEILGRAVLGIDSDANSRSLDVHVGHLRQKLAAGKDFSIETVHGRGYRFHLVPPANASKK